MAIQQIEAGSEVYIRVKVLNQRTSPPVLYDPDEVRLLLARPDESIALNYVLMTAGPTGVYDYAYQTSTLDQAGIWTIQVKTIEGSSVSIRSSVAAFELLSTVPAGGVVTEPGGAPSDATYITQTPHSTLTAEQALSALATGYMKVTTGTGAVTSQAIPIPVTDGGTGVTSLTTNYVLIGQGTSPVTGVTGTANQVLRVPGAGGMPTFGQVDLGQAAAVTGVLPLARGGNNSALGAIALMQFGSRTAVAAASTVYLGSQQSATEANALYRAPSNMTITNLTAVPAGAPGGSDTFTYRVRVNGADVGTALVLTGAAGAGSQAQSISVLATDTISVSLVTSATAAAVVHNPMIELRG